MIKKKDQIIFPLNEDILGNEKGSIVLITMIGQQDKYLPKTFSLQWRGGWAQ